MNDTIFDCGGVTGIIQAYAGHIRPVRRSDELMHDLRIDADTAEELFSR